MLKKIWRQCFWFDSNFLAFFSLFPREKHLVGIVYWCTENSNFLFLYFFSTFFKINYFHTQDGQNRITNHFQYMEWPGFSFTTIFETIFNLSLLLLDHGLPPSTTAFLELLHQADQSNTTNGLFVVHCRLQSSTQI